MVNMNIDFTNSTYFHMWVLVSAKLAREPLAKSKNNPTFCPKRSPTTSEAFNTVMHQC